VSFLPTNVDTPVPMAFWQASGALSARRSTAAAGGLLAPYASATASATSVPAHAGGGIG
jgi:hypothetical protein